MVITQKPVKKNIYNPKGDIKKMEENKKIIVEPKMGAAEYIKDRLELQLNWFSEKSAWSKKKYKQLMRIEFIIAAFVPVIITLSTMGFLEKTVLYSKNVPFNIEGKTYTKVEPLLLLSTIFQVVAAGLGVVLVIVKKYNELDRHYDNWKNYRLTAEELVQERVKYLTRVDPYDDIDAFDVLVETIEAILNKEHSNWKQQAKPKSNTKDALATLQKQSDRLQKKMDQRYNEATGVNIEYEEPELDESAVFDDKDSSDQLIENDVDNKQNY